MAKKRILAVTLYGQFHDKHVVVFFRDKEKPRKYHANATSCQRLADALKRQLLIGNCFLSPEITGWTAYTWPPKGLERPK